MAARKVGIFGLFNDLHALLVAKELQTLGADAYVVEVDHLVHSGGLSWELGSRCRLLSRAGEWFSPGDLDVIWWRRSVPPQREHAALADPMVAHLVHREWEHALVGSLLNSFSGWWVSHPVKQRHAENKLVQLQTAVSLGLRVPPTLVSQDPATVREFSAAHAPLIVKAVKGTRHLSLDTVDFDAASVDDESIRLSPAIYQAKIGGHRHVRINAFGDHLISIAIDTRDLDWRKNLNVAIQEIQLPESVAGALRHMRRQLGLEMAVFDGKFDVDGEFVFFEANVQGQFLFAQPLANVDLGRAFANFLMAGDKNC